MENKQQFIIEGIAKIDNVLDGIKKIQTGLGGLKVPDNLQKQFENLYKKAADQGDKAKKALSSGFETKGSVKEYTAALEGIARIYGEILDKTKGLKVDKDFLSVNFDSLDKANKELERLENELKAVKDEAKNAKNNAQKVFTGIANYYSDTKNYKNPFKEWREAAEALKRNDIPGVKAALDALEQKFQGKNTDSGPWAKRYEAFQKLQNAFASYEQQLSNVTAVDQQLATQQQVVNSEIDNASKSLDPLVELMDRVVRESEELADSEGRAAKEIQQLNSELEHFKNKAAYFFGIGNAINLFKRAVRSAYDTVKDLDAIMTETAVVTNFNVGDMWSQLPEYTQRANELGVTIHDTYEAATLFYQQGLKTNEVMQISNETLKMARIAGLDAATASDRMTNALRGFNMELDKVSAQRVNDVYSKLAAITASNTDEISTAMTKVASLAHNANMEFETTAAFLAQIIESTRESAETAGTALKTVVARFSEVKKLYSKGELLGQDEEGEEIDVNKVSTALRSAGINLNEYLTGAKGLDDIFIELAEKWDSLDKVQQRYIATMAAGSRQQSRFIALMSDYKRTMELVNAANSANGASQQQYEKTLESLQTKLARLKNAWNEFILGLANSDAIKGAVDLLTDLITAINNVIKAISGRNAGVKMITTFFTAFTTFKFGAKLVGKNSGISKFLASFIGTDANQLVQLRARDLAKMFYSSLADKIANPGSMKGLFKDTIVNDIFKYLSVSNKDFYKKLFSNPNFDFSVGQDKLDTFANTIGTSLGKGTLTIDELNQALKDCGQNIEVTKENAADFGLIIDGDGKIVNKTAGDMRRLSAAAIAAGGALMALGSWMETLEGPAKNIGTIVKGLGAGLLAFGTIMSVYLPLQAQIGAKAVTSAIVSIPIVGIIAGIISGIIALGVAISGLVKNNSLETKLEQASADAKAAADAANEAKEAYEKLGETWKSLDEKYDAIENATKGTQEWRDAIREVNDAVLELFNTYEGLQVTRDSNGILKITNQESFDANERDKALTAQGAASVAKIREYEASQNVRDKSLKANWADDKSYKGFVEEYRALGKLDELASMTDDEIKDILNKYYKDNGMQDAGILHSAMAFSSDAQEIRNYARGYRRNQDAIGTQKTVFGATILEKAQIDKEMQKYANTFVNDNYIDNLLEKSRKTYEGKDTNKIKDAYALARGYDSFKALEDADSTVKDLSKEQMVDYLATSDALEKANEQLQIFTNTVGQLDEKEKALLAESEGGALTYSQALDLKNYKYAEKQSLFNQLGGNEVYGSYEAFEDWFNNAVDVALNNFDTNKFSSKFTSLLDDKLTGSLSSETFKGFTNNLKSVWNYSGEEGVNAIQESIKSIKDSANMSSDELESFIRAINSVDWTSADSIATLDELANEYGISEEAIKALEDQIIDLNKAINQVDIEKLISSLGLAKKIGSGEQGRSFTKEQYEELINSGTAKKKDFVFNIETENYDYIGEDILDVKNAIIEKADDIIAQLDDRYANTKYVEQALAGGSAERDNPEELRNFIGRYIMAAGEDAIVDWDFFYSASLEDLRQTYDRLMQEYGQRYNIQNQMDEGTLAKYQTNTGAENVSLIDATNDENAKAALIQQVINSGLPEALIESLIQSVNTVPINAAAAGYANNNTQIAGNLVDTMNEATSYGIDAETLNQYVAALQQVDNLERANIDTLYQLALANAKYQEGFKNVIDSYDEWIQLKQEDGSIRPDEGNLDQLKAYGQLKKDLKAMFNLSEDVSDEFLRSAENVELMEKAVNGDTKAVSQLRAELAKMSIAAQIKPEDQSEIFKAIDDMMEEAGTLEFGASINDSAFASDLVTLLEQAGMTVDQINGLFEQIGWTPPIEMEQVPYTSAADLRSRGYSQYVDLDGKVQDIPVDGEMNIDQSGMITVPKIGDAKFVKPSIPSFKPKSSSSGGGGGSSKKEKPSFWENPYDELYNLQEKINESLRTREALERRYQKLLKQEKATLTDIRKSYYDQIKQLSAEAELERQFAAGRLRQIDELGDKLYTDSEGDRTSFKDLGVTKYASYDEKTGLITIDWNGLEEIANDSSREEEGKAAEAYISKLEELVSSYEEVRDKLWDIEDTIEELREAAIDSYLSFEDRVMDAVINKYQQEIDEYQAISDAIDNANSEVIDSLREQIELSRQIRDNTEKEQNITDMENRLAYLQRDTSGANDLEILKLQKDLDDARESYTDSLIDQAIDNMQKDADLAAEQRAKQITTMEEQLEIMQQTGVLWRQVHELINNGVDKDGTFSHNSELVTMLQNAEAFKSMSVVGQERWWEQTSEAFFQAMVGYKEAEDKYKKDVNDDGKVEESGTSNAMENVAETASEVETTTTASTSRSESDDKIEAGIAMAICNSYNKGGWGDYPERKTRIEAKGFSYSNVQSIVNDIVKNKWDDSYYRRKYGINNLSDYAYSKFKTGGLANFTGPAWLDGTKTKPELVLNAQDTANFIALKDILASLMNMQGFHNMAPSGGDNYFDINISATLESDYDVDKLTEKIKRDIYQDGQYRNVNTLNFLR